VDKFSTRYGYIEGRCNAKRKKHPGKLCKRFPLKGQKRCSLHNGGWHSSRGKREKTFPFRNIVQE